MYYLVYRLLYGGWWIVKKHEDLEQLKLHCRYFDKNDVYVIYKTSKNLDEKNRYSDNLNWLESVCAEKIEFQK